MSSVILKQVALDLMKARNLLHHLLGESPTDEAARAKGRTLQGRVFEAVSNHRKEATGGRGVLRGTFPRPDGGTYETTVYAVTAQGHLAFACGCLHTTFARCEHVEALAFWGLRETFGRLASLRISMTSEELVLMEHARHLRGQMEYGYFADWG